MKKKTFKPGDRVILISGRRSREVGTLVRFEWVNMLSQDMWLVDFDNNLPDGYVDENQLRKL